MMPLRVYADMDDTLCKFTKAKEEALMLCPEVAYPQSQYGFYANLEPMEDAIEVMRFLLDDDAFDPWIATAPSIENPMSYTEKRVWVESNLGKEFNERLIIIPNKSLLNGSVSHSVLVDDLIEGRGQEDFSGILLQFGTESHPNWKAIKAELIQLKNLINSQ